MKQKGKIIFAVVLFALLAALLIAIICSSKSSGLEVTFDSRGGTKVATQKLKKGDKLEEPEVPTKEGYEFIGWYVDGKKFDFDTEIDQNVKLEAKWIKVSTIKYTVSFDTQGGSVIEDQKISKGEKVEEPKKPSRDGYTFVGWTLDGKNYDFNSKVEKNITLVAVWRSVQTKSESTVSNNYNVTANMTQEVSQNTTKPKKQNPNPTPQQPQEVVNPKVPVYKVTFYDENNILSSIEIEEGKVASVPAEPTKSGYKFAGWFMGTTEFDFTRPITGNIELHAKWVPVLSLTSAETFQLNMQPTENNYNNIVYNQDALDIRLEGNTVVVTKNKQLRSYVNGSGLNKEWYGMLLDFNIDPNELVGVGYQIEQADIDDAKIKFGATSDTAFVVWLEAVDRTLEFRKKTNQEIAGIVSIDVREIPLTSNGVTKVDPTTITDQDQKYNNEAVTVALNGTNIEAKENKAMISSTHNNLVAEWYAILFDMGVDPKTVTMNGSSISDADINDAKTKFGATSDTAFVVWLKGDNITFHQQLTFMNQDQTSSIVYNVQFINQYEAVSYVVSNAISNLSAGVEYIDDKEIFSVDVTDDVDVRYFTFEDDGKKYAFTKLDDGTWNKNEFMNPPITRKVADSTISSASTQSSLIESIVPEVPSTEIVEVKGSESTIPKEGLEFNSESDSLKMEESKNVAESENIENSKNNEELEENISNQSEEESKK